MRIKLSALHDTIDFSYTPEELVTKLGDVGIEVESVERSSVLFNNVFVARVLHTDPHPTHHKLQIVTLDIGTQGTTAVCTAATNVRQGDVIPAILPGGQTADGTKIGIRKFGAVESPGMLCSWHELGLDGDLLSSEEKDGILHLPLDTPVGEPFSRIWPVADVAFDISVTPDRGDALSVLGIARWIETLKAREADRPYDPSEIKLPLSAVLPHAHGDGKLTVTVEDPALCSSYIGMVVEDVQGKPSAFSFRCLLYRLCVRPVNTVVDMTNVCLKQYGQPTHSFDYDKLQGHCICVRRSRRDESITTLDGTTHALEEGTLVITDANGPVAIAGVMGGLASSVTSATTRIVFEIAHFDPRAVARASRHMNLRTDAAFLYERGTDPGATPVAVASLLSIMIREQCPGAYISSVATAGIPAAQQSSVTVPLERVNRYLGSDLSAAEVERFFAYEGILSSLQGTTLHVTPPSFRGDLTTWPELVEEVVRMQGYDRFPARAPSGTMRRGRQSPLKLLTKHLRVIATGVGLAEARTVSFVHKSTVEAMGLPEPVTLLNPLIADWDALRPTMLIGLAGAAARNLARNRSGFASFEVGKVFREEGNAPVEETRMGILLTGQWRDANWTTPAVAGDVFVLKGIVESLARDLHVQLTFVPKADPLLEDGGSAAILAGTTPIGTLGIVRQTVRDLLGLEHEAFYAELSLDALLPLLPTITFQEFSRFPSIRRDLAVVVDKDVPVSQLQAVITENAGSLLREVTVFDNFQGGSLPSGKKSVGFSMEFIAPDRTLLGEEVDAIMKTVEEALATHVGGALRRTKM